MDTVRCEVEANAESHRRGRLSLGRLPSVLPIRSVIAGSSATSHAERSVRLSLSPFEVFNG